MNVRLVAHGVLLVGCLAAWIVKGAQDPISVLSVCVTSIGFGMAITATFTVRYWPR